MPARRNTIRRDEPKSLRKDEYSPSFTDEQLLVFNCFVVALIQSGYGVYVKMNNEGNSLRIKIYTDDDSYQDSITNRDNLVTLLADYADQLRCRPIFDGLLGGVHALTQQAGSGAPGEGQSDPDTGKGLRRRS